MCAKGALESNYIFAHDFPIVSIDLFIAEFICNASTQTILEYRDILVFSLPYYFAFNNLAKAL